MAKKVLVRYVGEQGAVDYVSRTPAELDVELARVRKSRVEALRILSRVRRLRHPVISSARFQLMACAGPETNEGTVTEKATELARLSQSLEQACNTLARLSNSRVRWLEEARFTLTYGATPKCRERATGFGKKRKFNYDDNEGENGDDCFE